MKPNVVLLFLFLTQQSSVKVSSIQAGVKKLIIQTRDYDSDLFTLYFEGNKCIRGRGDSVTNWCNSLKAHYNSDSKGKKVCSCTCQFNFRTFLPQNQTCVDTTQAARFGGCRDYFDGQILLQSPVDLQSNGSRQTSISSEDYNCSLHGHYFDYNGFQGNWQNMIDGIFSLKEQGNKKKEFSIVWVADTAGKLSGRIIRLNFTCNNKSDQQPSIKPRCMLFKALGTVTYYSSTNESSVNQSSYLAVPTSVDSHVPLPSVTYSSPPPPQPSIFLSHVPSPPQSLSLTSPALGPSLAFTASTRTSTPSGIPSFISSSHSQTSSFHTRPTSLTSGPIIDLSTSRTELPSSLPFHSEEASDKVVSTGIPIHIISTVGPDPIEPSKSSTEASSSSAVIDGPGDKKRQTAGNDNGVVIGAAVGGAVVFGILVIMIILFFPVAHIRHQYIYFKFKFATRILTAIIQLRNFEMYNSDFYYKNPSCKFTTRIFTTEI